uniref:Tudor domain-containing protein n=1 Tax=Plectus sambesii TaxID=2011161 RepID=A0A914V939_9BILA
MAFFTEGCCFRATPLSHHDGVLVLRTVDQEKAKEELEARLAAIVAMRGVVVPPQQKPPFVAGDIWLQANSGCWERVMLAHNQPKDHNQGDGLFMDRNVHVKLDRNGSCYRVPYSEVQSVSELRIPPIFRTMLVDSSYKLDEQLTDGKSLFDLIVDGTEIMCLVRRIDPLKKIPVVVWYPSTKTPWFERQMTLNPFALPTAESEQVVKGEVSDVVVVWLTADRTGEADYSVVLGRIDDGCGDSGENSSSPFRRFRQRQTEIERMATNMAPWDWESLAPPVGTRLLYECDGVRKSPTSIGPEWVRAVVTSVDFDDAADSWLVVVSLPDLGNRNFVLTGMANLKRRLRYNCNTSELDKFDREPPVPVSMCRLQGYHVAGDRRFDKEGFACLAKMKDIVVFFGDTVVDTLGNVIHETAMKGTDFRRKESDRCIDVGPILARADLLSECDGESLPTIATMTKKWEARLQFPVGTDAALGWPQNRSLSNRLQKVQVVRAERADELVVQLLNDDTRRMLRSLAAIYKTDVLCNIPMAELPCDRQLACIVHLDLHRFAPYSDEIFPRCAQKDGKMLARALVLRGVENKRREVYFYAVDMDLTGWISIDSVYYMPDLPALHIGAAAIQCSMNVVGSLVHAQHIKKILMTEELFAAFGPVTKCPKTDRRVVWLMRESFLLIDEMLTRSNVWSQTEKGAAKPPFSLLLMQEQLDESTPNLRGRFLYEIVKPNFDSSAYHSDDSFRFQVKCTENPSEPTALKLEDAARNTAVTGFLQPPHGTIPLRSYLTNFMSLRLFFIW